MRAHPGLLEATDGQVSLNVVDIIENEDTVEKAIILLEDYVGRNPELRSFLRRGWPFMFPVKPCPISSWAKEGGIAVGIDSF